MNQINAAIAQSVERILGKDEVASSNLASSSKKKNHTDLVWFFFCSEPERAVKKYAILSIGSLPQEAPEDSRGGLWIWIIEKHDFGIKTQQRSSERAGENVTRS